MLDYLWRYAHLEDRKIDPRDRPPLHRCEFGNLPWIFPPDDRPEGGILLQEGARGAGVADPRVNPEGAEERLQQVAAAVPLL